MMMIRIVGKVTIMIVMVTSETTLVVGRHRLCRQQVLVNTHNSVPW